jgi:uncharacterized protein (TIGR00290 family)
MNKNIACSWSGGKDSCFALMQAVKQGYTPKVVLTMLNENGKISRSHGISLELLQQQASALGLPMVTISSSWNNYEENFINTLKEIKQKYNIDAMVFGDIDIDRHRLWEEKVCEAANISALLPLWQRLRKDLALEIIESRIESIVVSCNTELGEDFLGKSYSKALLDELESTTIDQCGENGEFHSLVYNCPLFNNKLVLPKYTKKTIEKYCFVDWTN